jgi:hypothetical protein
MIKQKKPVRVSEPNTNQELSGKQRARTIAKWTFRGAGVAILAGILGISIAGARAEYKKLASLKAKGVPLARYTEYNFQNFCSGYAKDVAFQVSKKVYPAGTDAWDLPARTKVTFSAGFDREKRVGGISKSKLRELIMEKRISPGTLIGCFFTESQHNSPQRPFSHVLVYLGEKRFAQNISGPEVLSLDELYSKGTLFPICTMEPK